MTPKISIIVPVYKVELYLDRCVTSILNQTFTDFELILVDDGSPDECPKMCDRWEKRDNRIKVIHKKNGGLSSARNAGLDISMGNYIAFVDSDDWLEPEAIMYLYDLLLEYNADFSMAAFTRKEAAKSQSIDEIDEKCISSKEFIKRLLKIGSQTDVMYAHGKLYKSKLFEKVRYPEGIVGEDIPATFLYALFSSKVVISNRIVYHYFINPQGITSAGFSKRIFDLITASDLICDYAEQYQADEDILLWTSINRKRVNFGILVNLMLSKEYEVNYRKYENEITALREALKKDFSVLIKAPIPLSRKIVMFLMCYLWQPVVPIINFYYVKYQEVFKRKE